MGHEFSGEIVELGENVKEWKIGEKIVGINVALEVGEVSGMGIFQNGGFAEYVKVPTKYLFRPPEFLSFKDSILIETFANAFRAIKLSKIGEKEKIIIIGVGPIGLSILSALLKKKNPEYIIVVEIHKFLRDHAKKLGATEVFAPSKVKIRKFIKTHGNPSFIFDCAGNESSIKMAIELIQKGGTILLEGIHKGNIDFPIFLINSKEVNFKGCLGHNREDILDSIKFFEEKKVNPQDFITDTVPLKEIQRAFERFLNPGERNFIKTVVEI
jgi:2-desacetyl-2-hydroxyethyl bacteriochlorophyllide A dehydrogenase